MKYCGGCEVTKNESDFNKNKTKKDGLATRCRECMTRYRLENADKIRQSQAEHYQRTAESQKAYASSYWKASGRDKSYGLPPGTILEMLATQSNGCANSACTNIITWENSHLDHCHETGRVRGLLCKKCNWTLGYVNDNPNILLGLVQYLEEV